MPSLRNAIVAVAAAFVASARADFFIDPETVPLATRKAWCASELTQCPAICNEVDNRPTMVNDCDSESLTYGCICGNGQQPDIEKYSLTLPYFTCTEFGNQCVKNCGNNNHECQRACREDNPCGAQNVNGTKSSASVTKPASAKETSNTDGEDDGGDDGVFEGLEGDDTTPSPASTLEMGRAYGLAVVLGTMFAGFAML